MGFLGKVLSSVRVTRGGVNVTDVKVDPSGGAGEITIEHMGAPGDDSLPLDSDRVVGIPTGGTGRVVAGGYADTENEGVAVKGEKRLYSRDSEGDVRATLYLKKDGTIEIENAGVTVRLEDGGAVEINNGSVTVKLEESGAVEVEASDAIEVRNESGDFSLSADGALEANVTTLSIGNGAGTMSLDASGTWDFNGATIDPAGAVATALGRDLDTHLHIGSPTAPVGPISNTGVPV